MEEKIVIEGTGGELKISSLSGILFMNIDEWKSRRGEKGVKGRTGTRRRCLRVFIRVHTPSHLGPEERNGPLSVVRETWKGEQRRERRTESSETSDSRRLLFQLRYEGRLLALTQASNGAQDVSQRVMEFRRLKAHDVFARTDLPCHGCFSGLRSPGQDVSATQEAARSFSQSLAASFGPPRRCSATGLSGADLVRRSIVRLLPRTSSMLL